MAVITFSREAHSGTQDLARLLAQRLGYRYVSRDELTQAVTARSGVERVPQTVESEGRALSLWELISLLLQPSLTTDSYAHPTISVLTDPVLASHPGRTIVLILWLAFGWFLLRQ